MSARAVPPGQNTQIGVWCSGAKKYSQMIEIGHFCQGIFRAIQPSEILFQWCAMMWFDVMRSDVIWYCVIWCDMIWSDVIWYVSIWHVMIWCDLLWYFVIRCDVMWYDMICFDMIRCDVVWSDVIRFDMTCHDTKWYVLIWSEVMWCNMFWCDVIWLKYQPSTYEEVHELEFGVPERKHIPRWSKSPLLPRDF